MNLTSLVTASKSNEKRYTELLGISDVLGFFFTFLFSFGLFVLILSISFFILLSCIFTSSIFLNFSTSFFGIPSSDKDFIICCSNSISLLKFIILYIA